MNSMYRGRGVPYGRHVIEVAKAKVLIQNGAIRILEPPKVKRCPVHLSLSGEEDVTPKSVLKAVESMIEDQGMFTADRVIESHEDLVPFGASEILMSALRRRVVECAVLACDGAGTVVATKLEVVQGVGRMMTGLLETTPIPQVIEGLEGAGASVVDKEEATLNAAAGVLRAYELGFKEIAVTTLGSEAHVLRTLRGLESERSLRLSILVVHTSGIGDKGARCLADDADLVWGCASKVVRRIVGQRALLQLGLQIPIFALTPRGKALVVARLLDIGVPLLISRARLPKSLRGRHPEPLI